MRNIPHYTLRVRKKLNRGIRAKTYTACIKFKGYAEFQRGTGATEERQAKEIGKQIAEKIALEELPYINHDLINIDMVFSYWWTEYASKKRSHETMLSVAETLQDIMGDIYIKDIDDDYIDELMINLAEGGKNGSRSPATVNRHLDILSKALKIAKKNRDWKINKKNQFPDLDFSDFKQEEPKERVVFLSQDEIKKLASLLPTHISLAMLWSVYTGCRLNETKTLTWNRVYLEADHCMVHAKGGKDRAVILSEIAKKILAALPRDGDVVFDLTNRRRHWEEAREELGRPELRWHDLRHVFATFLRQYGKLDLKAVGRSMGHSNLDSTNRYAHVNDSELIQATNMMPNILPNLKTVEVLDRYKIEGDSTGSH